MEELLALDRALLLEWNGSDSLFLDGYMWMCTNMWMWMPLALVLFYLVLRNNAPSRVVLIVVLLALLITASDQISSGLLKPLVHRLRPTHDAALAPMVDTVFGYRGGQFGFPSSHAANSFALFTFTALLVRNWGYTLSMLLWASVFSYSRIYLGVHYPGDIVCGALLGVFVGLVFYLVYEALNRKLAVGGRRGGSRGRDGFSYRNGPESRQTRSGYSIGEVYFFIATYFALNLLAMLIGVFIMN